MKTYSIAVLPGDGIGPEVTAQAVRALEAVGEQFDLRFTFTTFPVGAAAVAAANDPLPPVTRAAVTHSDAVLLAAESRPVARRRSARRARADGRALLWRAARA